MQFFDQSLGFAVNRTAYIMRGFLLGKLDAAGVNLTPEEAVLLGRLRLSDGLRQSDLAEILIREKSTVTRLLDSLVRKGYVRREHDPHDRRVVLAWLTDEGRELVGQVFEIAQTALQEATRGISGEDLQTTMRTLRQVCENLNPAGVRSQEGAET